MKFAMLSWCIAVLSGFSTQPIAEVDSLPPEIRSGFASQDVGAMVAQIHVGESRLYNYLGQHSDKFAVNELRVELAERTESTLKWRHWLHIDDPQLDWRKFEGATAGIEQMTFGGKVFFLTDTITTDFLMRRIRTEKFDGFVTTFRPHDCSFTEGECAMVQIEEGPQQEAIQQNLYSYGVFVDGIWDRIVLTKRIEITAEDVDDAGTATVSTAAYARSRTSLHSDGFVLDYWSESIRPPEGRSVERIQRM